MNPNLCQVLNQLGLRDRLDLYLSNIEMRQRIMKSYGLTNAIIFQKLQPIPGEFKFGDGEYSLEDSIRMPDLNDFLNNVFVGLSRIRNLKKLVINCSGRPESYYELNLNHSFHSQLINLTYLECENVKFTNLDFLQSTINLQHVFFKQVIFIENFKFKLIDQRFQDSGVNYQSFFEHHKGIISRFGCKDDLSAEFFKSNVIKQKFKNIRILDPIHLKNLNTVLEIANNFDFLKRFNAIVDDDLQEFAIQLYQFQRNAELMKSLEQLRSDLTVELFGIPFNTNSIKEIRSFFPIDYEHRKRNTDPYHYHVNLELNELLYYSTSENDIMMRNDDRLTLLAKFCPMVRQVTCRPRTNAIQSRRLMLTLNNVDTLDLHIGSDYGKQFIKILNSLSKVCNLTLGIRGTCHPNLNREMNNFPIFHHLNSTNYHLKLRSLTLAGFTELDFTFLSNLVNLNLLRIYLCKDQIPSFRDPVIVANYLQVIENLKIIGQFVIYFRKERSNLPDLTIPSKLLSDSGIDVSHRENYIGNGDWRNCDQKNFFFFDDEFEILKAEVDNHLFSRDRTDLKFEYSYHARSWISGIHRLALERRTIYDVTEQSLEIELGHFFTDLEL